MSDLRDGFLRCIRASYQKYNESGARSTEKLKPAHRWLADAFQERLGGDYQTRGMRDDDSNAREARASGLYYDKKIDVAALHRGEIVSGVGFKFVTSNYKQNSRNYFESLLGETANLRRGDLGYGALMVLPSVVEYLSKGGGVQKFEIINSHNLEPYLRLHLDRDFPHKSDAIGIVFVDIDYAARRVERLTDIDKTEFSPEIKNFLKTGASLENFFNVFVKLTEYKAAKLSCR
ncbi:MAG: hypothetical protein ACR2QC_04890 [Gammaproteobacteria bacterium]